MRVDQSTRAGLLKYDDKCLKTGEIKNKHRIRVSQVLSAVGVNKNIDGNCVLFV